MSDKRFIKYIPSERSEWLIKNSIPAFILLTKIAERARRFNGHIDGLEIGWAIIGDYKNMGLSRQQYRTALEFLETCKIIEIIFRGRKDKKSTIKPTIKLTIKGTIVKLLDSSIYDINIEEDNHQANHQANHQLTISQPQTRKKKERSKIEQEDFASSASPQSKEKILEIFFNHEAGEFENITSLDLDEWKEIYPYLDIRIEIKKMVQWIKSNPSRSKKTLWRKFVTDWLRRNNDAAENKAAWKQNNAPKQLDNKVKALEKFKNGQEYNGYECNISEKAISFTALQGQGYHEVKLNENGFEDQLDGLARKLKIK